MELFLTLTGTLMLEEKNLEILLFSVEINILYSIMSSLLSH